MMTLSWEEKKKYDTILRKKTQYEIRNYIILDKFKYKVNLNLDNSYWINNLIDYIKDTAPTLITLMCENFNLKGHRIRFIHNYFGYEVTYICFENKEDALQFKLKWVQPIS